MASVVFPNQSKTTIVKDGTKYGYIKLSAKAGKPTLLFLHGYPSSSFHWHYQVKQCEDEGYGMIAPDLLGYGDTDHPDDFNAYDNTVMAGHVMEILDQEGLDKVIGIGHDWGSIFLATLARLRADRFSLLIFMAVGYVPNQLVFTDIDKINAQTTEAIGRPIFGYWHFHDKPEAASVIENGDPLSGASLIFPADPNIWIDNVCRPGGMENWIAEKKKTKLAPWMTMEQLEIHGKIIKMGGGYTGPLNWYKQAMAGVTAKSEANLTEEERKIKTPTLYIGATQDVICVPALQIEGMKRYVSDLTVDSVDASHWLMIEKPEETFAAIHGFIEKRLG